MRNIILRGGGGGGGFLSGFIMLAFTLKLV